ncbi:pilus assembly protein [Scandinavium lactucae]|uniref:Pilus assembly protein n=1 Tax=Scandinavium lactucae TaxID=3095028 RepID=A0ABU4QLC3_9ENTR|nr:MULTISPECIES: pilus assembly protein [unclassified Scandinavium]MDX6040048.1 pilus assembly protein [Scandinavium sp. V105_6]MDX6049494.1 pilus assembly protein [Scandinavium sp. V105_1]
MLNTLSKKNILTELIWDSPSHDDRDTGYSKWMATVRRSHRMYVYIANDDATQGDLQNLVGYSENTSPGCEPFAVHLRNLLGDGIYYVKLAENQHYFLIVYNGGIVSGTDCIVSEVFFNEMLNQLPESRFSTLNISEVTAAQFERIMESCEAKQLVYKRKQRLFWVGVGVGVLVLLIASAIFLYSIIAG